MTSLPLERAVGRMKNLYNQLKPSEDCMRELSTFSFDFEKVAKELKELRPDLFYKTQIAVEKNYHGKYVAPNLIFVLEDLEPTLSPKKNTVLRQTRLP